MQAMQNINIHAAKSQLSQLVANVANGERYIIAKAGKPQAMLIPLPIASAPQSKRIGFLANTANAPANIPDDFNQMGQAEILSQFGIAE